MGARSLISSVTNLVATRIAVRVALAVALVVVLLSSLLGALLIRSYHRLSLHQIENNAYLVSETIKSSTKHAMMINQPDHVFKIINEIGHQPGIGKVRIINEAGEVIYSPDKDIIGTTVDKDTEAYLGGKISEDSRSQLPVLQRSRIFNDPDLGRSLGVINPIYNSLTCSSTGCHPSPSEQSVLGVLDVTFTLGEAEANLQANQRYALWLLIGAIVGITAVIWISLRYLLVRPVKSLLRATEAVAKGDLEYRVNGEMRDEIGQLAVSFNEMTASLQDAKVQIYRSNKLASLGRLAAGVAHEINNPLTGVLSFSSFMLKRAPEGSEEQEDLKTIVGETKRCRQIVRGLLDFSRQVQPKKTRACFNTAVRRAHDIVRNQLLVSNVDIKLDLAADLPEVLADGDQLVQLILNLVVNASDAMKGRTNSEVSVTTKLIEEDGQANIEVVVSDNGPGIPDENVEKIFDPFFSTKGNEGTGLGLSVVWGIVDEHEGTIRVNTVLDEGTSFIIRMPVYGATPLVKEADKS